MCEFAGSKARTKSATIAAAAMAATGFLGRPRLLFGAGSSSSEDDDSTLRRLCAIPVTGVDAGEREVVLTGEILARLTSEGSERPGVPPGVGLGL